MQSSDPYIKIFAVDNEFVILKKLKRNDEAMKVLERCYAKNPKEPIILFDLGRMNIFLNKVSAGFDYLNKAKQNLNEGFTKRIFIDQLNNPDFDKVRDTQAFKKLRD